MNNNTSTDSSSGEMKQAYSTPRLEQLGRVSDLTHGTTSRTNDPGGSQNGKS